MFCVIVKITGWAGDDTMAVVGPFASKKEAHEKRLEVTANLIKYGVSVEKISTDIKEMVML